MSSCAPLEQYIHRPANRMLTACFGAELLFLYAGATAKCALSNLIYAQGYAIVGPTAAFQVAYTTQCSFLLASWPKKRNVIRPGEYPFNYSPLDGVRTVVKALYMVGFCRLRAAFGPVTPIQQRRESKLPFRCGRTAEHAIMTRHLIK